MKQGYFVAGLAVLVFVGAAQTPQTRAPGGEPQSVSQPGGPPAAAQLNFAVVSSITQKWTEKGGTEQTFDRPNLIAHR